MTAVKLSQQKKRAGYFATVPAQEILPILNSRFESSVKGIYVIGDVTGLPLVKVAANQGVEVIAKMEADGLFKPSGVEDQQLDLVIIGGGTLRGGRSPKAGTQVRRARTQQSGQHHSQLSARKKSLRRAAIHSKRQRLGCR